MPPNQRKLLGPESSFSYKLYLQKEKLDITTQSNTKKSKEPRKIYIKMGVLSQVKGSAYMEIGQTKIIAATFGPRELSKLPKKSCLGSVQCEVKYAPFGIENKSVTQISRKEKTYSIALKKALQPVICRNEFTNFQIDIFVYVLQDDGCVLSSAINCAGLALIDGGIPMYDLITAGTIGFRNESIFVDPSYIEEDHCTNGDEDDEFGVIVLSRLESHSQTSDCFQVGCLTFDTLKKLNEIVLHQNQDVLKIIKQVLVQKVKTNLNDKM